MKKVEGRMKKPFNTERECGTRKGNSRSGQSGVGAALPPSPRLWRDKLLPHSKKSRGNRRLAAGWFEESKQKMAGIKVNHTKSWLKNLIAGPVRRASDIMGTRSSLRRFRGLVRSCGRSRWVEDNFLVL